MNPKVLQYLMGHSDISVTLNTYTHLKMEDAQGEVQKLYEKEPLKMMKSSKENDSKAPKYKRKRA